MSFTVCVAFCFVKVSSITDCDSDFPGARPFQHTCTAFSLRKIQGMMEGIVWAVPVAISKFFCTFLFPHQGKPILKGPHDIYARENTDSTVPCCQQCCFFPRYGSLCNCQVVTNSTQTVFTYFALGENPAIVI